MSEPAKEKIYPAIPKSLWVTVDNEGGLSDIPKIRVKLEIDGVEEDIYNGYVVDGHVLHSRNLMGFIQRAIEAKEQEIIALESELKSARESAEEMGKIIAISQEIIDAWYREPAIEEGGDFLANMHRLKQALKKWRGLA